MKILSFFIKKIFELFNLEIEIIDENEFNRLTKLEDVNLLTYSKIEKLKND